MAATPENKGLYKEPLFRMAGDQGLLMEFGDIIDPEINKKIRAIFMALEKSMPQGVLEVIPTYRSIILIYDPCITGTRDLMDKLKALNHELAQCPLPPPDTVVIPVCYGGEFGQDLPHVAEHNGLSQEEVIRIHSETSYPVYMIGFTPGFPYLGGLSEKLHTPRLSTPRTKVPAGSVGIANNQTGIYPIESPGGWQLIGRCPYKLFDPDREDPFLIKAGDILKFNPVSREEFLHLEAESRA